jgi:hypothetical protein
LHRSEGDEGSISPATGCPPRAGKSRLLYERKNAERSEEPLSLECEPSQLRLTSSQAPFDARQLTLAAGQVKTPRELGSIAVYY